MNISKITQFLRWAGFYLSILTYGIFIIANLTFKWWVDPYGVALLIISGFWLAMICWFDHLKNYKQ